MRYAYFHNIMEGMSETEFAPNAAVTREQLAGFMSSKEKTHLGMKFREREHGRKWGKDGQ